jgi:hypothetical protein
MELTEKEQLLAKAQRLESKKLFLKAASLYQKIGEEEKAAFAFENAGAFEKAAELYKKLGNKEKEEECKKKLEQSKNQQTWADLQAAFVSDYPG